MQGSLSRRALDETSRRPSFTYGQRRPIVRLELAAAGISVDMPGDRIEGIDDEPDMYREDPHAQTVRAIVRRAVAGN